MKFEYILWFMIIVFSIISIINGNGLEWIVSFLIIIIVFKIIVWWLNHGKFKVFNK